jgi:hypothetical protein
LKGYSSHYHFWPYYYSQCKHKSKFKFWEFHGSSCSDCDLLDCDTMQSCRQILKFQEGTHLLHFQGRSM